MEDHRMTSIQYTGFRRTISEYTQLASRIPVIHETTEIRIKGLRSFCRKHGITFTPVIMAVAIEMHEFNCHFSTFAVIRDVNQKSIFDISDEIKRIRQLSYNEMPLAWLTSILDRVPDPLKSIGLKTVSQVPALRKYIFGTIGLSNLGKYGLKNFDTLFNLNFGYGIGGIEDKVVLENGTVEVVPVLNITQTSDHRIVDGAEAARVLEEIKRVFESGEYKTICGEKGAE
jgi:pyruvate/2-oxoglutarate dehydrogenase complex dihydrolipoamide acyltransferase (E2) component